MLGLLPGLIYGRSAGSIYINQFIDSTAQVQLEPGGRIDIVQRTGYPAEGRITLEIRPQRQAHFELKIRIPSWCATPSLSVNGRSVPDLQPGTYASVQRTWNTGDRVELLLPMNAEWIRGEHGNTGSRALRRGPLVYVADGVWQNPDVGGKLGRAAAVQSRGQTNPPELKEIETPKDALGPFYKLAAKLNDGTNGDLTLSPFANLGRWYADPAAKPNIKAELYGYSVWLPDPSRPSEGEG
jgi:hypothetical protein